MNLEKFGHLERVPEANMICEYIFTKEEAEKLCATHNLLYPEVYHFPQQQPIHKTCEHCIELTKQYQFSDLAICELCGHLHLAGEECECQLKEND